MDFTFDNYFEWLIPWEGSVYENDPADPGGATKYGIDQRSHPLENIRSLTRGRAKQIYRNDYWKPIGADLMPGRVAWALTDCAVNCGKATAVRWLQTILSVAVDGRVGPITINAAHSHYDVSLTGKLLDRREAHYRALGKKPRFRKFLKGWLNRNNDLREHLT